MTIQKCIPIHLRITCNYLCLHMFTCIYSILWFDRLFLIIGICCGFFFHLIADWINQMSCFGSDAIYKVTSNLSRGVKSLTFLLQYTSKRQVHQNIHKYNTWVNELNYIPSLSTDDISFIFLSKVLNCTKSAHTFSGIKSCRCNFAGCLCRITLCVHVFVCVCAWGSRVITQSVRGHKRPLSRGVWTLNVW